MSNFFFQIWKFIFIYRSAINQICNKLRPYRGWEATVGWVHLRGRRPLIPLAASISISSVRQMICPMTIQSVTNLLWPLPSKVSNYTSQQHFHFSCQKLKKKKVSAGKCQNFWVSSPFFKKFKPAKDYLVLKLNRFIFSKIKLCQISFIYCSLRPPFRWRRWWNKTWRRRCRRWRWWPKWPRWKRPKWRPMCWRGYSRYWCLNFDKARFSC